MRRRTLLCVLAMWFANAAGQTRILGRVTDADSMAVPLALVRLLGLDAKTTNAQGYFDFAISKAVAQSHALKAGADLYCEVEKPGMVMLEPPDGQMRLPHNWTYQKPLRIILCRQGSPLLARSERMLQYVLQQKIAAAVEAKETEMAKRDVLAGEARRLGLPKAALLTAVAEYKDRLRTSADLNERGLAALDDALEAEVPEIKQKKLAEAENNFREARSKDEAALDQGLAAAARLPKTYYYLGLTYYHTSRYDSALVFFSKAEAAAPAEATTSNLLGRTLEKLARPDSALGLYQHAVEKSRLRYGRKHPKVAAELEQLGEAQQARGNHLAALAHYREALQITETATDTTAAFAPRLRAQIDSVKVLLQLSETNRRWQGYLQRNRADSSAVAPKHN